MTRTGYTIKEFVIRLVMKSGTMQTKAADNIFAGRLVKEFADATYANAATDVDLFKTIGVFKPKDEEPYGRLNPKWTKFWHR